MTKEALQADDCREAFEARWASKRTLVPTDRNAAGEYICIITAIAWETWQSARNTCPKRESVDPKQEFSKGFTKAREIYQLPVEESDAVKLLCEGYVRSKESNWRNKMRDAYRKLASKRNDIEGRQPTPTQEQPYGDERGEYSPIA